MSLEHKIESVLFYRGEPVETKELQKFLKTDKATFEAALSALEQSLAGRGVRLMRTADSVMLATAPEASELIQSLIKEELLRDIGKAGIETLAIVLYLGPVTRSRIDYIRGVNSSFIVRNLMVRGLIERVPHPEDSRAFNYQPTMELLAHLGVAKVEDLPEYDKTVAELKAFESSSEEVAPLPSEQASEGEEKEL